MARPGMFDRVVGLADQVSLEPHPGPDRDRAAGAVVVTVVFVHGVPETAAIWDPLIAALGRDDVVALSPPGFGAPVPEGFEATFRRLHRLAGRPSSNGSTRRSTWSATTGVASM